jgi:hypothetical protein
MLPAVYEGAYEEKYEVSYGEKHELRWKSVTCAVCGRMLS